VVKRPSRALLSANRARLPRAGTDLKLRARYDTLRATPGRSERVTLAAANARDHVGGVALRGGEFDELLSTTLRTVQHAGRRVRGRSYTETRLGPVGRARELAALYRVKTRDVAAQVDRTLQHLDAARGEIEQDLDERALNDGDVLVIGPGQHLSEVRYWAHQGSQVVGIDLNPPPSKPTPSHYYRMFRNEGAIRAVKTLGRRATGVDAAYVRGLERQLGSRARGTFTVLAMDAGRLGLRDDSFDLVYSRSVFEHLREPGRALGEIARVLKPGGVAHIALHLYTADSGAHDARILGGNRNGLPYWAHLRPRHHKSVKPNSYLNRLRLEEWRRIFASHWPECRIELRPSTSPLLKEALPQLRLAGELHDYSDEELLTVSVVARWQRPMVSFPAGSGQP
jgi:SAM-dependent methyltransferase